MRAQWQRLCAHMPLIVIISVLTDGLLRKKIPTFQMRVPWLQIRLYFAFDFSFASTCYLPLKTISTFLPQFWQNIIYLFKKIILRLPCFQKAKKSISNSEWRISKIHVKVWFETHNKNLSTFVTRFTVYLLFTSYLCCFQLWAAATPILVNQYWVNFY